MYAGAKQNLNIPDGDVSKQEWNFGEYVLHTETDQELFEDVNVTTNGSVDKHQEVSVAAFFVL